jgi:hypothetical protein
VATNICLMYIPRFNVTLPRTKLLWFNIHTFTDRRSDERCLDSVWHCAGSCRVFQRPDSTVELFVCCCALLYGMFHLIYPCFMVSGGTSRPSVTMRHELTLRRGVSTTHGVLSGPQGLPLIRKSECQGIMQRRWYGPHSSSGTAASPKRLSTLACLRLVTLRLWVQTSENFPIKICPLLQRITLITASVLSTFSRSRKRNSQLYSMSVIESSDSVKLRNG